MALDWKALAALSPSYRYSTVEKLRFLAAGFRQRCRPATHLLAGPFAGEFGYEMMQWQGFVRRLRPAYQKVHVLTYPGRDYLYEGCTVHAHDILLQKAGYGFGLLSPADAARLAHAKARELGLSDYDVFHPALLCTKHHRRWLWQQEFRLFEEPPLDGRSRDLAFHFRAVKKDGPDNTKNYSPALADELAERLLGRGLSVICIGHPDYSYCAKGCEDRRTVDLRAGVVALNSVRAVAGENSGPMHLANLCGKPTILWAVDQWRIDYSLRWNPFRVPIYTAANDTHQPEPKRVCAAIVDALENLKQRTDGFARPCYTLPAQRIAAY